MQLGTFKLNLKFEIKVEINTGDFKKCVIFRLNKKWIHP